MLAGSEKENPVLEHWVRFFSEHYKQGFRKSNDSIKKYDKSNQ